MYLVWAPVLLSGAGHTRTVLVLISTSTRILVIITVNGIWDSCGFCGLGIEKIGKKSEKSRDCLGCARVSGFFKKSASAEAILAFSPNFSDFVG